MAGTAGFSPCGKKRALDGLAMQVIEITGRRKKNGHCRRRSASRFSNLIRDFALQLLSHCMAGLQALLIAPYHQGSSPDEIDAGERGPFSFRPSLKG